MPEIEKEPTGWYLYRCHKCRGEWRSRKSEADMLKKFFKSEDAELDEDLDDFRGSFEGWRSCPKCGEEADEVMCRIEYGEARDWRKRWPELPPGVTAKWITKTGCPVRFKAIFKGRYLGTFTFIQDAANAVAEARREWEKNNG